MNLTWDFRLFYPQVACTNWKRFLVVLKRGEPYGNPRNVTVHVHVTSLITYLKKYPKNELEVNHHNVLLAINRDRIVWAKHFQTFCFVDYRPGWSTTPSSSLSETHSSDSSLPTDTNLRGPTGTSTKCMAETSCVDMQTIPIHLARWKRLSN